MRTSMKKLAVLVAVFAMTLFVAVTMASAGGQTIHGEYAFIGSGACLFAPGFTDETHFIPRGPSSVGPNIWEGVYTFHRDGTGEMQAVNRFVDNVPSAGLANIYWKFTYDMTKEGKIIKFTYIPDTYTATWDFGPLAGVTLTGVAFTEPYSGRLSPNGEILFVSFGVPMKLMPPFPGLELVCNGVQQGFRTNRDKVRSPLSQR